METVRKMLLFGTVSLFLFPCLAHADGGTMRFSKQAGKYRITLFTSPASLHAGVVDFSVLVQTADSDRPLLDIPVMVHVYPDHDPERRSGGPATTAAATNKLFHAIALDLSESGRWHVEVAVGESRLLTTVLEVGPPMPAWIDLALWIGWPAIAILFFAFHQYLVRAAVVKHRMNVHRGGVPT
jgi:hypothetical protein